MFNISKAIKSISYAFCLALLLTQISVPGLAQSVTPMGAKTQLATPVHGIDMTVCVKQFDWDRFVTDYQNYQKGPKTVGFNSNPYIDKQCVYQEDFATNGAKNYTRTAAVKSYDTKGKITDANYTVNSSTTVNAPLYKNFNTAKGAPADLAKATLGDLPVLGLSANGGFDAQSLAAVDLNGTAQAGQKSDRIQLANHLNIYNASELATMYGTNTVRSGAPRFVSTGRDGLNTDATTGAICTPQSNPNNCIYNGGRCSTANGQFAVRTKLTLQDGVIDAPASQFDATNPLTTCRIDTGSRLYEVDQNFKVYQFLFVTNMPTEAQCKGLASEIPYQRCLNYYKKEFNTFNPGAAKDLSKRVVAYTYYGFTADASFACQTASQTDCDDNGQRFGPKSGQNYSGINTGWKVPDLNGPRQTFSTQASEAQIRDYYGDTDTPITALRNRYNGFVKAYDGYNVYLI
ncbi:MAG: hypothetical protein H7230_03670 [Candidatus Parcubacteria bacterium]|nr:hypothetical protein [Candidatus Paceibacterota bacterium]